ncbi:phosphoribosylaminoimidazolesuccinocarboxamide synthase [Candidatus Micrarchaeota archaeon]|nr:phosphoribosylaminoimidazolesuccinocarboxamide synthase [Candidatus Micrarchaeota archaeon]
MEIITNTHLPLPFVRKGKVRDSYSVDDKILMISTDRLSAFDVVFEEGIPYKGHVLNQLSAFWFDRTKHIIANHLLDLKVPPNLPPFLNGRSMLVKSAIPVRLECVVRGYLTGGGYTDYKKTGMVGGIALPSGLKNGSKLETPIFTPSTKAEQGHDEPLTPGQAINLVGSQTYEQLKQKSLELYSFAHDYALSKGLVLADTKFEFGYLKSEEKMILIDEALTPDSSRYWLREKYDQGVLESLDKQYVRDYLETLKWNKQPPAPKLPQEVVQKTSDRYLSAYMMLTGKELSV